MGKEKEKSIKEIVLEQAKNNRVVFTTIEGFMSADVEEFITQPVDGILYDLNRLPEVVLTYIDDIKWVNDFAVQLVIKKLYKVMQEKNTENEQLEEDHNLLKAQADKLADKAKKYVSLASKTTHLEGGMSAFMELLDALKEYEKAQDKGESKQSGGEAKND
jgi:3-deoxy-D-manno-octulosonate 8-phosphate phosphatase KdsC-like HAD superfamily phosphatase